MKPEPKRQARGPPREKEKENEKVEEKEGRKTR